MNRSIIVAASALALSLAASSVATADPSHYNWTGLYLGANAGGAFDKDPQLLTIMNNSNVVATSAGLRANGAFGGGQVGYNWQHGWIVFGVEADLQADNAKDSYSRALDTVGDNLAATKTVDYFGTVRGRLGVDVGGTLLYGTGGYAYGKTNDQLFVSNGGAFADLTESKVRSGYALGAGFETAVSDHWSIKGEYLHVNLGGETLSAPQNNLPSNIVSSSRLDHSFDTLRVGLNFKLQ